MFILRTIILKNGFIKIKTIYHILDVVLIILGYFLQIIYIDRSIVITNFFKSSEPPYLLTPLSLVHKVN